MGHGDEIAVVDANFPAASLARRLVTLRGADTADAVTAILVLLPLDAALPHCASVMRVADGVDRALTAIDDILAALARASAGPVAELERFEFYERARNAFAIVSTGELRSYGNALLVAGALAASDAA